MPNKLKEEKKLQVYRTIIEHPALSDYEVADKLKGVSRSTVNLCRKQFIEKLDYELARNVAGKFLADFQQASDYFKVQIERLENLKKEKKTIQRNNVTTGKIESKKIELEPMDILAIEKQQTELWKNIIFLARQSEAVEVMKLIQNGRITIDNKSS